MILIICLLIISACVCVCVRARARASARVCVHICNHFNYCAPLFLYRFMCCFLGA